jgi:hypothetical protein
LCKNFSLPCLSRFLPLFPPLFVFIFLLPNTNVTHQKKRVVLGDIELNLNKFRTYINDISIGKILILPQHFLIGEKKNSY